MFSIFARQQKEENQDMNVQGMDIKSLKLCNRKRNGSRCAKKIKTEKCPAKDGQCISGIFIMHLPVSLLSDAGLALYKEKLQAL